MCAWNLCYPLWGLGDESMPHPRKKKLSLLKPDTLFKIVVWRTSVVRSANGRGSVIAGDWVG